MKKYFLIFILTCLVSLSFTVPGHYEIYKTLPSFSDSVFIIGVLESGAEGRYDLLTDTLETNLWHRYPDAQDGWITVHNGWQKFDYQDAPYNQYGEGVKNILAANQNAGMYTLMNRGKIQQLCFGQRSDYQCEKVSMVNPDYWFYTYKNRETGDKTGNDEIDDSQFGSGTGVVYCNPGIDNSGYVAKGLKANREQINCLSGWGKEAVDASYIWYIKPRIRINQSYANSKNNKDSLVARIDVIGFDSSVVKQINLRVRNFLNKPVYDGNYIEEFVYEQNDQQLMLNPNSGELLNPLCKNLWDEKCGVDFRVYWYGKCEMWIDYVRVENDVSHRLLSGKDELFEDWLNWEVNNIAEAYQNNIYRFYIEEFEFNQIPCMSYVAKKLNSLSDGNFSLMCDFNYSTYKIHMPGFDTVKLSAPFINNTLIKEVGSKEIFMGAYGFLPDITYYGYRSYVPNTLPVSSSKTPERLGSPVNVSKYENWLQVNLDTNRNKDVDFVLYYKLAQQISKLANIPFINLIQAHSWYQYGGHQLREPTNEEISLLAWLGLSYGAKGMIYYWMQGIDSVGPGGFYSRGLGNPDAKNNYGGPRYVNTYGQEKWGYVSKLNKSIKNISSHLMNFESGKTKSYIYRLADERNAMNMNTFISELKTYLPLRLDENPVNLNFNNLTSDSIQDTYLQTAFFTKQDEPGNIYFMIVNRRCAPYLNNNSYDNIGGRRLVTIKINSNKLPNFSNWKIYVVETGNQVAAFNKNINEYVYLGDFMPGEGRLFRLEPVQ